MNLFSISMSYAIFEIIQKKALVVYIKFKFNCAPSISSGSASLKPSKIWPLTFSLCVL